MPEPAAPAPKPPTVIVECSCGRTFESEAMRLRHRAEVFTALAKYCHENSWPQLMGTLAAADADHSLAKVRA